MSDKEERFESALKHLNYGDGLYAIGMYDDDNPWSQELRWRREYVKRVLKGEDPDEAWQQVKDEAQQAMADRNRRNAKALEGMLGPVGSA